MSKKLSMNSSVYTSLLKPCSVTVAAREVTDDVWQSDKDYKTPGF